MVIASMTYPGIKFSFGWLNAGFILGYGYPRKWWMLGRSAMTLVRGGVLSSCPHDVMPP